MNLSAGTITRTIVLFLAIVNHILTALSFHPLPINEDEISELISLLAIIIAAIPAWWKNNSFTKTAIEADKHLEYLKEEQHYVKD